MNKQDQPEAWLRGPVEGILPQLQPAAFTFIQTIEDSDKACASLSQEELWSERPGLTPVGFHLRHLAGATDRLLTYARGEDMSEQQLAEMKQEKQPGNASAAELVSRLKSTLERALAQLRSTPEDSLYVVRQVGRGKLPSTTIGLMFHAAEHAHRHFGQIATTLKILRNAR